MKINFFEVQKHIFLKIMHLLQNLPIKKNKNSQTVKIFSKRFYFMRPLNFSHKKFP